MIDDGTYLPGERVVIGKKAIMPLYTGAGLEYVAPRGRRATEFRKWNPFPDHAERFEEQFGREAALHWGLRRRPASAVSYLKTLQQVYNSKTLERQFYDESPLLTMLEARQALELDEPKPPHILARLRNLFR